MSGGITLHKDFGINSTIPSCYFCGGEKNEIVLLGNKSMAITGYEEAPMHGPVMNMHPCDKCEKYMKMGIIVVSIADGQTPPLEGPRNPVRTGCFVVLKEEAVERFLNSEVWKEVNAHRFMFMDDETWDALGLPRENIDEEE